VTPFETVSFLPALFVSDAATSDRWIQKKSIITIFLDGYNHFSIGAAIPGTPLAIEDNTKPSINGNTYKGVCTMKTNKKTIIGLAAVLTLAIAAFAYAHGGGYGGGYMMGPGGYGGPMMGSGYGGHMMGYGPGYGSHMGYGPHMRGYDNQGYLSDEDAAKLDQARDKFFNSTRDLRRQIDEKQYAIQEELSKDSPDTGKVVDLQKALSSLQADFDQKALAYRMEMKKLVPQESAQGPFGGGYGGYCW
jgi:zinc resistance-associated protein